MDYRMEPSRGGQRASPSMPIFSSPDPSRSSAAPASSTRPPAYLIGQFVRNLEAKFGGAEGDEAAARLSAGSVAWQLMKSKIFGRDQQ